MMGDKEHEAYRKKLLIERHELTLKQENKAIKKTNEILELEEYYKVNFKFKRVLNNDDGLWVYVIYFIEHNGEEYQVISRKGARTSLSDRVWKALNMKRPARS